MTPLTPAGQALLLTEASVALLLEHRAYPGCTMASLTIRERLEDIERQAADRALAELRREVEGLTKRDGYAYADEYGIGWGDCREAFLALIDKASKPEEDPHD